MATKEVLALDEATPQILAPQAGDTYLMPRPLGITGVAGTSALTITDATQTTSQPALSITQTWNDAAVTFTGAKINVTSTASAAGSMLLDLQVAGTSKFNVTKTGAVILDSGIVQNWGYAIFSGYVGAGSVYVGNPDGVPLVKDAAHILAQSNGTNAQTLRVYRTFTDASNYQRIELGWNTSTALLMNTGAGTGADGNIAFNDAALATTATTGYVMIPSCAGAPTGVPADIPTGQVALHFDSTNNKLYVYDGAWLSTAALT